MTLRVVLRMVLGGVLFGCLLCGFAIATDNVPESTIATNKLAENAIVASIPNVSTGTASSVHVTASDANALGSTDWPHWAGPQGNCTTNAKGLLKSWPKDGPPVLWRIRVGTGSNHPSVAGNVLCFAQLDEDGLHESIKCLDASSGQEKWSHTYEVPPVYHVGWGELGVRATPTITDKYIYTVGTFGDGFCFERDTGKVVWKANFREQSPYLDGSLKNYGNLEWKGFNGSLLPIGDKLVMFYWQGGNPAIPAWEKTAVTDKMQVVTYDTLTGKMVWKFEEPCAPGTRGPGLVTGTGLPIVFNNQDCVVIHGNRQWKILRLADGKQVWNWECSGPNEAPAWASGALKPVGDHLYLDDLNGWQKSLVECDFSQADPKPKILWTGNQVHEAVTPPVIVNGHLYGFWMDNRDEASELGNKPGKAGFSLRCTELKSGKMQWSQPGFRMGLSLSAAEGLIYVRSHQTITLIEANPVAYTEKGRMEKIHDLRNVGPRSQKGLLDWNMPVIARGCLFIRTPFELICYDITDHSSKLAP
jgi:outer membrane protein assembly factor BamB